MVWWHAALWAFAGGFVVEGLEFAALQRRHHKWPWEVDAEAAPTSNSRAAGPLGYLLAELVRLAVGGILGAALAGQVTGPLPALAIGAAAPVIAGHLVAYVPLPPASTPARSTAETAAPSAINDRTSNGSTRVKSAQRRRPAHGSDSLPERRGTA